MKLQVAFDMQNLDQALTLAQSLEEHIDIMEIGSLLLYAYGKQAIEQFRSRFPHKTLLADMKIVDRGKESTLIGLNAGADWVTVLAGTGKSVIHAVCITAHEARKRVMLDLIDSTSPSQSALEATSLGVDALLFHKPADDDDPQLSFLERWDMVRGNTKLPVFIAAALTREQVGNILDVRPDGIVLSKTLTESSNPLEDIIFFRSMLV